MEEPKAPMTEENHLPTVDDGALADRPKQPYARPRLERHGDVRGRVLGPSIGTGDSGGENSPLPGGMPGL